MKNQTKQYIASFDYGRFKISVEANNLDEAMVEFDKVLAINPRYCFGMLDNIAIMDIIGNFKKERTN